MEKTRKKFKFKKDYYGYIFIAPFFIVFAVFQLYPMISSLGISVTDYAGFATKKNIIWWDNYVYLWKLPRFWQSFVNTGIIWSINFLPQIVFALLFAAIFTSVRLKMRGAGVFKVIYFMPNILTATSIAVLFASLFQRPDGPLDQLIKAMGLVNSDYNLYRDAGGARFVISFIQFWRYFGHSMIVLSAGMLGINPTFYEAAEVDGATKGRMFFSITLPLLKPILLFSLVTSLIGGLQIFEIPFLFTSGLPMLSDGRYATETIAVYVYKTAFDTAGESNYALASAASVYLFVVSIFFSVVTFKIFGEKKDKGLKKIKKPWKSGV